MSARLLQPHERIRLVTASNAAELGRMFLRPQEFTESPRYRGKFFTLPQFKRYYARHYGHGRFTYYRDFRGYNIPGEKFLDWQTTYASRETQEELDLLRALGPMPTSFYLIGALAKDTKTLEHEFSHAFFHLFEWYRAIACRRLALYDLRDLKRALKRIMYAEHVLDDECVSYVLFEEAWLRRNGVEFAPLRPLRESLRDIYNIAACDLRAREDW